MNRRSFLRALPVAGTAALAGCSANTRMQSTESNADSALSRRPDRERSVAGPPRPGLGPDVANDWRLVERTDDRLAFDVGWWIFADTVHADVRTNRYEYRPFERRLSRQTLGRYDGLATTFAASQLTFRGRFSGAVTPRTARPRVATRVEETLTDQGLQDVTRVPPSERRVQPVHPDGEHVEFTATHGVDPVDIDGVGLPEAPDATLSLDGGTLQVRSFFSIWAAERADVLFVAGGAYAEDATFARTATTSLTGSGVGDGVDVTVDVALDLAPAHQRTALRAATGTVS